jgi:hypothetical protein
MQAKAVPPKRSEFSQREGGLQRVSNELQFGFATSAAFALQLVRPEELSQAPSRCALGLTWSIPSGLTSFSRESIVLRVRLADESDR